MNSIKEWGQLEYKDTRSLKFSMHTWQNVCPVNGDIIVSIRTLVLIIPSQSMKQITDYILDAVMPGVKGDPLSFLPISN